MGGGLMSTETERPAIDQPVTLHHPVNNAHGQNGKVIALHESEGDPKADPPVPPVFEAFTVEWDVGPTRSGEPATRTYRFPARAPVGIQPGLTMVPHAPAGKR